MLMEDIRSVVSKYVKPPFEYEIYLETSKKESIEVSEERLESLSKSTDSGLGIRVLWDNRMGFAYTTHLKEEAIKDCVEKAMEICKLTPQDNGFSFNCEKSSCESWVHDSPELSLQDKIDLTVSLEKKAKHLDDRIKGVRKISLEEKEVEVYCYNSCGLEYYYKTTFYTSSISTVAEHNGDASISYDFRGARKFKNLDLDGMLQEVVFKTVSLLNPEPYETKIIPVILFRSASAMLLEAFSSMFSGESLLKNRTLLKDRIGQMVSSKSLSIIDDGTMHEGFMSFSFDAEGIKSRRKVLVDKGMLKGFFHSLYTANKLKTEPTGNSIRDSFKSLPSCRISNFYIERGDLDLDELLNYYQEVFLVLDLMGLHTVDPVSGDFSLGASGIIYKRGKKEKSVRGVTLSGNVLDLWKGVVGIGKDLTFYANIGSPSLLIEKLTVSG